MRPRTLGFALSFLLLLAPAVHAKSYSADHFDARIRVLRGGGVEVTETVVFRFQGTFTEVFRRLPTRRTDGIEVLGASMDASPLTIGTAAGQYDVSGSNTVRVRWHFAPVTDSVHTFELTYVARGVVRQSDAGDLLQWQALPSEHDYSIRSSAVAIDLPVEPSAAPSIQTRRTGTAQVGNIETHVTAGTTDIRSNGWLLVSVLMPSGSVLEVPPDWQVRQLHAGTLAPTWRALAAAVLAIGLILLVFLRHGYDSPDREEPVGPTGPDLPDTLPPALAGALVSNGRSGLEQAMATLFVLAGQGELTIVENAKRWGQRHFTLKRTPTGRPLADYERAVLDATFTGREPEDQTDLPRARRRIVKGLRPFARAVGRQMIASGLIDEGRLAARNRYAWLGSGALLVGALAMIPAAVLADDYGPWPLIVPAAVVVTGMIALIVYAALTPLSNEGIRRARAWRGFKKFVRQVTRDRASVPDGAGLRILPFAVATGLATGWAAYLKKHDDAVPAWFRAVATDEGGIAFAYFVGTSGAGPSSGGAGGSGAAGGGASGAH